MERVFIVSAKRTAIGRFHGKLSPLSAADMACEVIKAVLSDAKIETSVIDEVIFGNILMAGQKQGIARQAAVRAGLPVEVPAYGLNMICGSGMKSVMNAYMSIAAGFNQVVLAGGTESMSNSGFVLPGFIRRGNKMGDLTALDHAVCDGLTDAFQSYHMGVTAENIAERYEISRQEQDEFALASQQKAIYAIDNGYFKEEIVSLRVEDRAGEYWVEEDEHPNRRSSPELLAKLRPAFKKDGTVTAGNASGINDGASCLLLMSEQALKQYGLVPKAEIIAVGQAGVNPEIMGMGPVGAVGHALQYAELSLKDMQSIELNEAFASQSIAVVKELSKIYGMSEQDILAKTNLWGGAIALGHPIGSSGNRIIVTLLHRMLKENSSYGLASLCIGGGMGTALILKKSSIKN